MSATRYVFKNRTLWGRYLGETDPVGTVELYVDWERLVKALGTKAARNKKRTSKLDVGIKAKFIPAKGGA